MAVHNFVFFKKSCVQKHMPHKHCVVLLTNLNQGSSIHSKIATVDPADCEDY